jgi:hypothetical protein
MFLAAAVMAAAGNALNQKGSSGGGFALIFAGIFLAISALVIMIIYANQERVYRKTMAEPLLDYSLSNEELFEMKKRNIEEIKTQNLISLIIMLFFFLIVIVVGLFLGRDGRMTSLIMLIIAVVITLFALLITKVRIEKIRRSDNRVILSRKGALLHGQFHNWSSLGAEIDHVGFEKADIERNTQGRLRITYSALTRTGRNKLTLNIIFSAEHEQAVLNACRQLGWPQEYS